MKYIANPPGAGGWPTAFTGLSDTPASYVGQAGKAAIVNPTETGIVFGTVSGGGQVDGGFASAVYGGTTLIDGGTA